MNYPEEWDKLLETTNTEINKLPYKSDAEQYSSPEFWENIDDHGAGDCEDYALGKLRRLWKAGYPIEALHLATCEMAYQFGQGGHAVLVCDTPEGRMVLSNGLPVVKEKVFAAEGFKPLSIQTVGGQRQWSEWKI